ncbi:MAG: serine--tRNA ligase [Planctomycetes bacterium]|nr:serine--tRNA ligase [Planctomycetota bacterium]
MLSMETIRGATEKVKAACRFKNCDVDVDSVIALDDERKAVVAERDELNAERNRRSKDIGRRKRSGEDTSEIEASVKQISVRARELDAKAGEIEAELERLMLMIPNVPDDSVPQGASADDNVVVRDWGEQRSFGFAPKPHYDVAGGLGMLDLERGAKVSGSFFPCYTGAGALLERALVNFMLDMHTGRHGYREVFPPFLVNRRAMTGTGQIPKLEEDMYRIPEEDLFLIPTAEVPVTNLYAGEVLAEADLPVKLTAYTACFRREAGSYGKDTRGIVRVHQFNKVEMVKLCAPEQSPAELESLVRDAEDVLQALGLHYRVVMLSAGDMSFAAARCYDIEIWAPGMGRYLEVSSCSNFRDFQARRMNCRFRGKDGKLRHAHTLNGSGTALPRIWIAVVENCQQEDGCVVIPEALRPYMHGMERIRPPE